MTGTPATSSFKAGANPYGIHLGVGQVSTVPGFKLGDQVQGDAGAVFEFCSFTDSGSGTTLVDGSCFVIDGNNVATLLTTSNSPFGGRVGVGRAAGTVAASAKVYLWLQIHGEANVLGSASSAVNKEAETTATAGQVNAPSSHTTGAKTIVGVIFTTAVGGGGAAAAAASLNFPTVGATN